VEKRGKKKKKELPAFNLQKREKEPLLGSIRKTGKVISRLRKEKKGGGVPHLLGRRGEGRKNLILFTMRH